MKNNKCTHRYERWEEYQDDEWCEFERDHVSVTLRRLVDVCLLEDIDTHRMKCSACGGIEYYSKAAKDFYEKGIDSDIIRFSLTK
jgi:hypothetical protein